MKLYLSTAGIWEAPGKQSKGAEKIDVPTDTAGLVAFLNTQTAIDTAYGPEPDVEAEPAPPPTPPINMATAAAEVAQKLQTRWTTDAILEFILDHADVNQVANILSCLGTRVGEMAKERRA